METKTGSSMRIKKRIEVTGTSADQVNKSTRDASLHCFRGGKGNLAQDRQFNQTTKRGRFQEEARGKTEQKKNLDPNSTLKTRMLSRIWKILAQNWLYDHLRSFQINKSRGALLVLQSSSQFQCKHEHHMQRKEVKGNSQLRFYITRNQRSKNKLVLETEIGSNCKTKSSLCIKCPQMVLK